MTTTNPGTGGCLCGAVRYALAALPTGLTACHCQMCRRHSGGVHLGFEIAAEGIAFDGAENIGTFQSSDWAERGFCRCCGSSLFWRMTAEGPMQGTISLGAGTLDSHDGLTFEAEIYIDAKPDAYAFAGERPRLTEAEVLASVGIAPPPA